MTSGQEYLTVYADASYRDHVAGFGFVARYKSSQPAIYGGAGMSYEVEGNCEAETYALATAIIMAYDHFKPERGTIIVVRSDSQHAIGRLQYVVENSRGGFMRSTDTEKMFAQKIRDLSVHFTIRFRHIKGHQGNGTPQTYVHNWCDREATRQRLMQVAQNERRAQIAVLEQESFRTLLEWETLTEDDLLMDDGGDMTKQEVKELKLKMVNLGRYPPEEQESIKAAWQAHLEAAPWDKHLRFDQSTI